MLRWSRYDVQRRTALPLVAVDLLMGGDDVLQGTMADEIILKYAFHRAGLALDAALIRERVNAGLAAARRRGRRGGRPPALDPEKVDQITFVLDGGASKASVCRGFGVARSTLDDTLKRLGWRGSSTGIDEAIAAE